MDAKLPDVELLICTTCRHGLELNPDATRPGALLHKALEDGDIPEGVSVRGVECLSNCTSGCSIVLRGGDARWSYVYGNLSPDQTDVVLDGVTRYRATSDGLVPWRERPEHFRKNCIARIPPLEPAAS